MSIKNKLLKIKDKINSVDVMGETLHYKHFKGSHSHLISNGETGDADAMIFALCACEKNGEQMFTVEEIDQVKELPSRIINTISKLALLGDEKKPLGR